MSDFQKNFQESMEELGKSLLKETGALANQAMKASSTIVSSISAEIEKNRSLTSSREYRKLEKEKKKLEEQKAVPVLIAAACLAPAFLLAAAGQWILAALPALAGAASLIWLPFNSRKLNGKLEEVEKKLQRYDELEYQRRRRVLNLDPQADSQNSRPSGARSHSGIHPYYGRMLMQIELRERELNNKIENLNEVLDLVFAGSEISKNRYRIRFEQAHQVVLENLGKARIAVNTYSSTQAPSAESQQVMSSYLNRTDDILANLNRIADELLKIDQQQNASRFLDEALDELASTTHYYRQKS